jgi:hypothetical protein
MFKYIKMGVIIHTPTSNIYASVHTSEMMITKNYRESDDSNIICEYSLMSAFNVFTDEDDYNNRKIAPTENAEIYQTQISVTSNTFPSDPYALLYQKFKLGLHSYTDDI